MATSSLSTFFNSPGAGSAVGSIGNAINAYANRQAANRMGQVQLEQLRENIAFNEKVRAEQIAYDAASLAEQIAREKENLLIKKADQDTNIARMLETLRSNVGAAQAASDASYGANNAEVGRQQTFAQAAGDAFGSSLGQFQGDINQDLAAKTGDLSSVFMEYLNQGGPASNAPAATGVTADREASARAMASGQVADQAQKLAAVQALSQVLDDKNRVMGQNKQLDAIINNFARGSQSALAPEIQAKSMFFEDKPILTDTPTQSLAKAPAFNAPKFIAQDIVQPAPSMLGDLFVGMSTLGAKYLNQQDQTSQNKDLYSLTTGRFTGLNPSSSGLGLKPGVSGLGIR